MRNFFGALTAQTPTRGRASRTQTGFDGYHVITHYAGQSDGETSLVERRFAVRDDGSFTLSLSDNALADEDLRLSVVHPTGEMLAATPFRLVANDGQDRLANILVARPTPGFVPSDIGLSAQLSRQITGRIMSPSGAPGAAAGQPVSVKARNAAGSPINLWSGTTDQNGYFRLSVSAKPLTAATVSVGTEGAQSVHPVTLEDGFLPSPLIIVAEMDADDAADCSCDVSPPALPDSQELAEQGESYSQDLGTACQTMTIPNRTLEEFNYFQIVRTTDPAIRGTGRKRKEMTHQVADDMAKIVYNQGTLAQATGATKAKRAEAQPMRMEMRAMRMSDARSGPVLDEATTAMIALDRAGAAMTTADAQATNLNYLAKDAVRGDMLVAQGVTEAAQWGNVTEDKLATEALRTALARIPAEAVSAALADPDGFTPVKVMTMERRATAEALHRYLGHRHKTVPGRGTLNEDNPIDWDLLPEFYQATSVAHGHVLQYRQEWKADGYSLGDLVQSIPLAPGQQKQIVTFDWDRSDRAALSDSRTATEALEANLARDRDINEIANAQFRENIHGSSSANVAAVGGGIGLAIGPLVIGGGGGSGWASSTANQNSARRFSADTMNRLSDQTSQAVSAVRQQRATTVRTVRQREKVSATTEVISNFNRCHALTVQYFEVLRHFAVHEDLVGVKECLFVPLEMRRFDDAKVLRWRQILERACGSRSLRRGFAAIDRLSSPATTPPDARFADDPIEAMSGRLRFRVSIARPKDPTEAERTVLEQTEWRLFGISLRVSPETIYERYRRNEAKKEDVYRNEIAPEVAESFLNSLEVVFIDRNGEAHPSGFDLTVASRYQEGGVMEVELNDVTTNSRMPRAEIAGIEVRATQALPEFSKVILEDAFVSYRTERLRHRLVARRRIHDDVDIEDAAFVSTADMSWIEERNKLADDRMRRTRLLRHLNDHIEFYHRSIWLGMDKNRRYMLLDGFEAPNARGRSIASVVENRLIGVVGNCLVMPVAPGFQLDPVLRAALKDADDPEEVLDRIYKIPQSPPRRLSVPTRGVFGEAIAGTCNSCEVIDEDRFWRWSNYPLPDSPPAIAALSTDSRYSDLADAKTTPFPDALIKYQNLPEAPAPTGMSAALGILAKDVFKDMSGLSLNQQNALAGLTASLGAAQSFASGAMGLALARDKAQSLDRTLGQIEGAKSSGYLSDDQASTAARKALMQSFGGTNTPTSKPATSSKEVSKAIKEAAKTPGASASVTTGHGDETETVAFETSAPDATTGIGATPTKEWLEHEVWLDIPAIGETHFPPGAPTMVKSTDLKQDIAKLRRALASQAIVEFDAAGDAIDVDSAGNKTGTPASRKRLDMVQSAIDGGLMRVHPDPARSSEYQLKVKMRIGYPGKSGSKTTPRAVHFPHSGKRKMPLAVMVHGQTVKPWRPTGKKLADVTVPGIGAAVKTALTEEKNHEGYRFLQDKLAEQAEPVISLSVSVNFANVIWSLTDTRSQIVVGAIKALKAEIAADPKHFLKDAIDFDNVCLIGHSRGGEAVNDIAGKKSGGSDFTVKSVFSIAPTDAHGLFPTKVTLTDPSQAYFCIWGGLDNDVSGLADPKHRVFGSGLRVYDRCTTHKSFLFAPQCTHNGFNSNWSAALEWRKRVAGKLVGAPPPGVATDAQHQELLSEYLWAFCDLTLNGTVSHQSKFRGEVKSASPLKLAAQSSFGSRVLVIDDFESGTANQGTRTLGAHMTRQDLSGKPVTLPADVGKRKTHVSHMTKAAILDLSAGAGRSKLSYDLSSLTATTLAVGGFDRIQMRLGTFYPVTGQAAIDAHPLPDFVIRVTETSGDVYEAKSADVYAFHKLGVGAPQHKKRGASDVTQMALHSIQADKLVFRKSTGELVFVVDFSKMKTLEIDFSMAAASGEIWVDSVELVKF